MTQEIEAEKRRSDRRDICTDRVIERAKVFRFAGLVKGFVLYCAHIFCEIIINR